MGIKDARRQLVQGEFPVVADDGMAGICAALEPDDNVRSLREQIGDLSLAFVAPVGSDDRFDHGSIPPVCSVFRGLKYYIPSFLQMQERIFHF